MNEFNHQLLRLMRDYKDAVIYRETYRFLLSQYAPELTQPMIQDALAAVRIPLDQKFGKAEQELLDGINPQKVLEGFWKP